MGIFKLEVTTRLMFTQISEQILGLSTRRLLAWNARSLRLEPANVIRADHRFESRARDSQLVTDFKSKLRQTEDMIGKLGYSLRELSRR